MIYIGIDPGKHTGIAVWDTESKKLIDVDTLLIHQALDKVRAWVWATLTSNRKLHVIVEDARQRTYIPTDPARIQGAGSIKRDSIIWEDFLKDLKIPHTMQGPHKGMTKMTEEYFKKISGWEGRTSNHARDAALLVMGR